MSEELIIDLDSKSISRWFEEIEVYIDNQPRSDERIRALNSLYCFMEKCNVRRKRA